MLKKQDQTFNDGLARFYETVNDTQNGRRPAKKLSLKSMLRYEERTVGMTRFWEAKRNDIQIDRMIRCPLQRTVCVNDIAALPDGAQFAIRQVQYPKDVPAPVMDISLERLRDAYAYI